MATDAKEYTFRFIVIFLLVNFLFSTTSLSFSLSLWKYLLLHSLLHENCILALASIYKMNGTQSIAAPITGQQASWMMTVWISSRVKDELCVCVCCVMCSIEATSDFVSFSLFQNSEFIKNIFWYTWHCCIQITVPLVSMRDGRLFGNTWLHSYNRRKIDNSINMFWTPYNGVSPAICGWCEANLRSICIGC